MHPNANRIHDLYQALERGDGAAMAGTYAPTARFRDPVFTLQGEQIGAMWHMFCNAPGEIAVSVTNVEADESSGRAHWEPQYRFGRRGRRVHNRIDAAFRFEDGLIVEHVDSFSFWRWAAQALGISGALLGWSPLLQRRVRAQAMSRLDRFMEQNGE